MYVFKYIWGHARWSHIPRFQMLCDFFNFFTNSKMYVFKYVWSHVRWSCIPWFQMLYVYHDFKCYMNSTHPGFSCMYDWRWSCTNHDSKCMWNHTRVVTGHWRFMKLKYSWQLVQFTIYHSHWLRTGYCGHCKLSITLECGSQR